MSDRLTASQSGALIGTIDVPGDKSMSHRALIFAGLATGETRIEGLLEGDDVLSTARALRALGVEVERVGESQWRVVGSEWASPQAPVDCGNSGTGARLLMGATAGFPITVIFTGDESLSRRPMRRVLDPLRAMGARVEAAAGDCLPATISGGGLHGITFRNTKASAQVKSAILLAGLHADGPVEVIEPVRSRDHSETMLRAMGVDVITDGERIALGPKRNLTAVDTVIPGDPSSAAFAIVAALLCPGSAVTARAVMLNPLRTGLFATLAEMGADIAYADRRRQSGEEVADIVVRASMLRGVNVPADRAPSMIDEYPILAIAAAFADGTTVMHGLAELRVKESDRLAAIIAGLQACGVEAREDGNSLLVEGLGGRPRGAATIDANHDHRLAMSFLVLGMASEQPVSVTGAATIATSFPTFVPLMRELGAALT